MWFVLCWYDGCDFVALIEDDCVILFVGVDEFGFVTLLGALEVRFDCAVVLLLVEVALRFVVFVLCKIVCVGFNYCLYVKEIVRELLLYLVLFTKFVALLCGLFDPIVLLVELVQADWEGELVVVIGWLGWRIVRVDALGYVVGYAIVDDVLMRDY